MCRIKYFPKKGDIITLSQGTISVLIIQRWVLLISLVNRLSGVSYLEELYNRGAASCSWGRQWMVLWGEGCG